ncbi:MAG: AMMECR1 domain-containing protein [Armatimonadota bacterium]
MNNIKILIIVIVSGFLLFNTLDVQAEPDFDKEIVNTARRSLFEYLKYNKVYEPVKAITDYNCGVFVTLTKNNKVRGCMGTVFPKQANLSEEIVHNTILAASGDTRHQRISMSEYPHIKYNISLVKNVRRAEPSELNPKRLGLFVVSGSKGAVLLPGEAKTAGWQLYECRRKAGIKEGEPVIMYVFETVLISG